MSAVSAETGLGTSILIVDDEPGQRESLMQMIGLYGYQIETAADGTVAIDWLNNEDFDLVLLDLNMPGLSGFEVIDYVVENTIPCKIVVVSGEVSFESARSALKKGAHDFVKKPYAPDELLATIQNATATKRLEDQKSVVEQKLSKSEYLHRFIVEHSPDIVFMLNTDGRFTFLNDAAYNTLGYSSDELLGEHYSMIVSEQSRESARFVFTERRTGVRKSQNVELKLKCQGESEYRYFDTSAMSMKFNDFEGRQVQGTYGVARDVTENKRVQELINFPAYYDILTKLPNRSLMEDRLSIAITQARRSKENLAVMFLDLDRFKWINDTLGHRIGDRMLQAVSQRMENCIRSGDTLARFGGDEFVLVLPKVEHHRDAEFIANKILKELKRPFVIDQHELYVSGSIGIAIYPEAGETRDTLIQSADIAMYRVKERGKNGFEFFSEEMNIVSNTRLAVERELRKALVSDDFKVCYHPQVNAKTEEVVGFEALIRWHHAEKGIIFPDDFIPIAEETGLILDIGNYVLETACHDLACWRKDGAEQVRVSINFSAIQVQQDDFIEHIVDTLQRHNLPGSCLEIEITENIIMNDMSRVIQKLRGLTELGIKIAVDDFGTGHSSLSYLQHFPISTLKIDKSFVSAIQINQGGTSIVDAIVAMAHGLNLNLVAEGVETDRQLEYLIKVGCAEIQGWLFGKAETEQATRDMLKRLQNGGVIRENTTV
ncbi:MAG TPA: EAL domain-containing protein [Gammaproteobacteria bacterium]|nr:EAL domain-containing protein [Gammaproteobacteria bacterium]HIL95500.1 EAL domain-containing protein [Pseudomonadales bacterium]